MPDSIPAKPSFRETLRFWLKLGCISFGGPAGQIAIMHRELVERKRWIAEGRFLHALNFCMLLPGPEATQLATYCGWLLNGVRGGIAAGVLFVLPGAIVLWGLSWIYVSYGALPAVTAVFNGLKAAVLAIVVSAVLRVGRRALRTPVAWLVAAAAFVALFFLGVPFPWVVAGALAMGWAGYRFFPGQFGPEAGSETGGGTAEQPLAPAGRPPTARIAAFGLMLWFAPVVAAGLWQGRGGLFARMGWFFSKAAVVTFGGAYAVLPYVAQQAVAHYHWVTPRQMLDGLAFAETTPGPLILVLQFVGFLAGWFHRGDLSPLGAATAGAFLTTWVTFVPTYLFVLLGAPYVERLRGIGRLNSALGAVTAAVVGVILNLAVWFALQTAFPRGGRPDWFIVATAVAAFIALQRFKLEIVPVLLASGALGLFAWRIAPGF
jgi:chromate transporter